MRLTAIFLLVLNSCALVGAPASKPALPAPTGLTATLTSLDGQGQRELLAGFELELGDERAKTAAANQRAAKAEADRIVGIVLGFVVGAIAGGATAAALKR
jgi:hypothetical protein